jgi:HK97 family phage prohead protease
MDHEKFTGEHSHAHTAMGDQGGDATHTHTHAHDGDANHGHSHNDRGATATLERRFHSIESLEVRSSDAGELRMSGYASLTNSPYPVVDFLGEYQETIQRGAFRDAIQNDDVRLLVNHTGIPFARTKSGTLTLEEDSRGLHVDANLDGSSPEVQSMVSALKRGDLNQMSFAFQAVRQSWSNDFSQRNISEVNLFDVSVVTYPANPATSAAMRSGKIQASYRLAAMARELREGKTFSGENQEKLASLLEALSQIDDLVDLWQPKLAEMLGVPNPDADDDGAENEKPSGETSSDRSWLSASVAEALAILTRNK